MHSNGGSFFFILIYIHIGRALYYGSYKKPRHKGWFSGIVLFLFVMGTAFLGYVLPWGLMSFWGGTVITNFLTVIPYLGEPLAQWIWAGFVLGYPTITRFFGLHFLIPFIISALSVLHILLLHMPSAGSSNPLLGADRIKAPIRFHPYFQLKDMLSGIFVTLSFFFFLFYYPNYFSHTDNYILCLIGYKLARPFLQCDRHIFSFSLFVVWEHLNDGAPCTLCGSFAASCACLAEGAPKFSVHQHSEAVQLRSLT